MGRIRAFFGVEAHDLVERGYLAMFAGADGFAQVADEHGLTHLDDIPYSKDGTRDPLRTLDIVRPTSLENAPLPVVVFAHGGGWRSADKRDGTHANDGLCTALAKRGIIAVSANYRLAPAANWQVQVRDLATAVAWVHDHIQHHGGDPQRIVLAGHSAGAHLTGLLAMDQTYLADAGVPRNAICGYVSVAGVADVASFAASSPTVRRLWVVPAFGRDPDDWRQASPSEHASAAAPPTLVVTGERDHIPLGTERLTGKLIAAWVTVKTETIPDVDHYSILGRVAEEGYPLADVVSAFVREVTCST